MSLEALRPSDRLVKRLRLLFIGLIVLSLLGIALAFVLEWMGFAGRDHPAVMVLVVVLVIAGSLEFALESLRQAGRHEDGWWRP